MQTSSSEIKPPQQARSRRTLERLLTAAEELLADADFDRVGVVEITRRAGVASGSFYNRFSTKDDLLAVLYEDFLDDPEPFAAVVAAFRGHADIRHIFFGHVHRPVSGSWRGIAFSALPSTAHQVALDFETVSPVPKTREPPAYGTILIEPAQTLVHICAYLDSSRIEGAQSPPPPGAGSP